MISPTILLKVIDDQEAVRAEFGPPVDFGEPVTNQVGNSIYFTVGSDGGPVAAFSYQNRVEKYATDGRIVWRADRPLNFDTKVIEKGKFERTATSSVYKGPTMNRCSNGVAVDGAGRVWVVTYRRQIKPEEVIRISMSGNQSGSTVKARGEHGSADDGHVPARCLRFRGRPLGKPPGRRSSSTGSGSTATGSTSSTATMASPTISTGSSSADEGSATEAVALSALYVRGAKPRFLNRGKGAAQYYPE